MSEEARCSSGERKRPTQPVLSSLQPPEKKAKNRLSSVAQRALAALGADSESSSSSDDDSSIGRQDTEGDSPVISRNDETETERLVEEISATPRHQAPPAREVEIEVDFEDAQHQEEKKNDPPEQSEPSKAISDVAEKESNKNDFVHKKSNNEETARNGRRKNDDKTTSQNIMQSLDSDIVTASQNNPMDLGDVNLPKHDSPTTFEEIVDDEDIIFPHTAKSEYNDILSSFISIPFDDKAMLSLHKSKEGTRLGQSPYQRWILSQRGNLPIIPQKEFITKMKAQKESASKQHGESIDRVESPMTSASITDEVSAFLMQEGQLLIQSPLPSNNEPHQDGDQDQASSEQHISTLHPTSQQQLTHQTPTSSNNEPNSLVDQRQASLPQQSSTVYLPSQGHQASLHNKTSNLHQPSQSQPFHQTQTQQHYQQQQHNQQNHPQHQYQPNLTQFQQPNYYGFGHQQQQYYSGPTFNSFNNPYQNTYPGHQQQNNGHWMNQYYAAAALPFPNNGASNVHTNSSYTSAAPAPAQRTSALLVHDRTAPVHNGQKVATASEIRKLRKSNKASVAKLPVAFGFWLDDKDGSSKKTSRQAKRAWMARGKMALETEREKQGKKGTPKNRSAATNSSKTPQSKAEASPKTSSSILSTPKTPRAPATLLSSEAAPGLPVGWMSKTFQRASGKTAGTTDTYFYSPQTQIKFRAMKSCKAFIEILGKPGVDGNEKNALKLYKERGHRV